MTLQIDPPIEADPTINVVLVGPPKTGKTAGAASAPGPVLYLNADLPARMRYARLTYGPKVQPVTVGSIDTLSAAIHEAYDPDTKFKTVVVDPVGELYRILLEEESGGRTRPTLNQYGDTSSNLEAFCRKLCQAPVNVVFVCHDHLVKDEGTGETERLPWTGTSNPKLGRTLLGMVDIIGFTGVRQIEGGDPEYVAQLVPAKGRPGGDGFNCLADPKTGIRKVDLSEWIQTIKEHEKGIADAAS